MPATCRRFAKHPADLPNTMKTNKITSPGNAVQSCDDAGVVIGGEHYARSLIITPEKLSLWRPAAAEDIGDADWRQVADMGGGGEVILLGIGKGGMLAKPQWLAFFAAHKMALETMSIRAACRTYSVLTTDGRPAILALIIP